MNSDHQKAVMKELVALYGDAINTRGIIFGPTAKKQFNGKVSFNVIDSDHPNFGRHVVDYSIDSSGKVIFSHGKQNK